MEIIKVARVVPALTLKKQKRKFIEHLPAVLRAFECIHDKSVADTLSEKLLGEVSELMFSDRAKHFERIHHILDIAWYVLMRQRNEIDRLINNLEFYYTGGFSDFDTETIQDSIRAMELSNWKVQRLPGEEVYRFLSPDGQVTEQTWRQLVTDIRGDLDGFKKRIALEIDPCRFCMEGMSILMECVKWADDSE